MRDDFRQISEDLALAMETSAIEKDPSQATGRVDIKTNQQPIKFSDSNHSNEFNSSNLQKLKSCLKKAKDAEAQFFKAKSPFRIKEQIDGNVIKRDVNVC